MTDNQVRHREQVADLEDCSAAVGEDNDDFWTEIVKLVGAVTAAAPDSLDTVAVDKALEDSFVQEAAKNWVSYEVVLGGEAVAEGFDSGQLFECQLGYEIVVLG